METKKHTTFDELSMERSKSFVKSLQELKNLRPQLYSAAEYCEKSYISNDQKQMVLENLKDYAMRALVNAVDHLGTVASKLTDVVEQQTSDVSHMEIRFFCVNQKLLSSHMYASYHVLREYQPVANHPRLHKRYVLPNSVFKKVHFRPHSQTDLWQLHQPRSQLQPSGNFLSIFSVPSLRYSKEAPRTPSVATLSWHLTAESKSQQDFPSQSSTTSSGDSTYSIAYPFHDGTGNISTKTSGISSHLSTEIPSSATLYSKELRDMSLTSMRSSPKRESANAPSRGGIVLSALFMKPKNRKLKGSAA